MLDKPLSPRKVNELAADLKIDPRMAAAFLKEVLYAAFLEASGETVRLVVEVAEQEQDEPCESCGGCGLHAPKCASLRAEVETVEDAKKREARLDPLAMCLCGHEREQHRDCGGDCDQCVCERFEEGEATLSTIKTARVEATNMTAYGVPVVLDRDAVPGVVTKPKRARKPRKPAPVSVMPMTEYRWWRLRRKVEPVMADDEVKRLVDEYETAPSNVESKVAAEAWDALVAAGWIREEAA